MTSPDYPSNYPGNIDQTWSLSVAANQTVVVLIEDLQLEAPDSSTVDATNPPSYSDDYCRYDLFRVCGCVVYTSCKKFKYIFVYVLAVTYMAHVHDCIKLASKVLHIRYISIRTCICAAYARLLTLFLCGLRVARTCNACGI